MKTSINVDVTIPEEHLRAYSNLEINELPLQRWEGETHVVRNEKQLAHALKELHRDPLLGFDTETRPVFKKGHTPGPPHILQLCTDNMAFVIHLRHVDLKELYAIMADTSVTKAGVAVHDDLIGLKKIQTFEPGNFVDLGQVSQKVNMQTHGLRNLAANLLGFRISKAAQCSNWARDPLTQKQIHYAATDAWVSRELYLGFKQLRIL